MSWTYKHRKLRDKTRAEFEAETGFDTFDEKVFLEWLERKADHPAYRFLFAVPD